LVLDRYITSEITKPLFLGVTLLMVIFTGYTAAIKLGEAASGLIDPETVAQLIGLSTIIALEVLLPTALYLSIIATLSRLYRDSEMVALRAAGVGELRIMRSLVFIAVLISVVAGIISVYGRPGPTAKVTGWTPRHARNLISARSNPASSSNYRTASMSCTPVKSTRTAADSRAFFCRHNSGKIFRPFTRRKPICHR
jgi:hypothetical protein